jgi:hypothetical protein
MIRETGAESAPIIRSGVLDSVVGLCFTEDALANGRCIRPGDMMNRRNILGAGMASGLFTASGVVAQAHRPNILFCIAGVVCADPVPDAAGLQRLEPLLDHWMRDTYVTYVEADDTYYLTGTTAAAGRDFGTGDPHARDYNDGIYLWRSKDMTAWEPMGLVWSLDRDAAWQNRFVESSRSRRNMTGFAGMKTERRSAWAPEFHYINGNYYITACMNWHASNDNEQNGRVFILKSSSGKPEGPYVDAAGRPLANRIDPSLFQDDDGSVYFVWQENRIARMKDDLSGFAEEPRRLVEQPLPGKPYVEGAFLTKHNGRYYLVQAVWQKENKKGERGYFRAGKKCSYDFVVSSSDHLYGPYSERTCAIRGAGHNNIFKDREGQWWSTFFGNPLGEVKLPFTARPAVIPIRFDGQGGVSADWKRLKGEPVE